MYTLYFDIYMDVSENSGTPKSSMLIGFSIINHPFWGTPIFGNTHIYILSVPLMVFSFCHQALKGFWFLAGNTFGAKEERSSFNKSTKLWWRIFYYGKVNKNPKSQQVKLNFVLTF